MDRRTALVAVVALLTGPLTAPAVGQPPAATPIRVGILGNVPPSDREGANLWGAFVQGLRDLGYVEGQNLTLEQRYSEGNYERLPALADELVRLNVNVIVVPAVENAQAARRVTRTIPIVGASLGDPVANGLVASYARPGQNVTGLSFAGPQLAGKQIQLLKETLPTVSRLAILKNRNNPALTAWAREGTGAARALRLDVREVDAGAPADLDAAFTALTSWRAGALLVLPDGMFLLERKRIADLARERGIPTMYALREHVDAGGLVFYGASLRDSFRRAATYVDKIARGAHPGDLPIEQPSKFDLVLSLKTARALRLTIPRSVLLRADEVLE